jgi:SAM-dependent methyltransferase
MLERARLHVGSAFAVQFVEAELFTWRLAHRFDAVFFGFWISHVPDESFDQFWDFVKVALKPGGQVFFVDDNRRTDDELIEGADSPIVQRKLNDGQPVRVIKIPYEPARLETRLRSMSWDIRVTGTSGPFYGGTGGRP